MVKVFLGLFLLVLSYSTAVADEEAEVVEKVPAYISLGKPMVLNLATDSRKLIFLQVQADVLVDDETNKPLVETHIPAIRHELILLLSEQPADSIKSPVNRENVRQQLTDKVRNVYREMTGEDHVQEILFSTFLIQ